MMCHYRSFPVAFGRFSRTLRFLYGAAGVAFLASAGPPPAVSQVADYAATATITMTLSELKDEEGNTLSAVPEDLHLDMMSLHWQVKSSRGNGTAFTYCSQPGNLFDVSAIDMSRTQDITQELLKNVSNPVADEERQMKLGVGEYLSASVTGHAETMSEVFSWSNGSWLVVAENKGKNTYYLTITTSYQLNILSSASGPFASSAVRSTVMFTHNIGAPPGSYYDPNAWTTSYLWLYGEAPPGREDNRSDSLFGLESIKMEPGTSFLFGTVASTIGSAGVGPEPGTLGLFSAAAPLALGIIAWRRRRIRRRN